MENTERIQILEKLLDSNERFRVSAFYRALETIGAMKFNYHEYMTTGPVNCDVELKRLPEAGYDLCCALLTMLLREDHFCNGTFDERYAKGQVKPIVHRMIELLS